LARHGARLAFAAEQRRSINWRSFFGKNSKDKKDETPNQVFDTNTAKGRAALKERLAATPQLPAALPKSSIFADETSLTDPEPAGRGGAPARPTTTLPSGMSLLREHLDRAVDPNPRARARWQRHAVASWVKRNLDLAGEEPAAAVVARTERQHMSASTRLPTSVKKLGKLARQIAGKTVDDALVQMRFSRKKMAREVAYQLEQARDEAVVQRGMGLGQVNGEAAGREPAKIQLKSGKWHTVEDPTKMYVSQAWVMRKRLRWATPVRRARGRVDRHRHPTTSEYSLRHVDLTCTLRTAH
jgi:ribosomal protein L22